VHRKNRFFRRQTFAMQQERGGVSPPCETKRRCKSQPPFSDDMRAFTKSGGRKPPVVRYHYCTGVREHTDGSLPRLCGSAFASALPNPHGGLTFTALDDDDRRSRRNRFSLQVRYRYPRRADARRSCLNARTRAGEMATFAMHKRMYNQERGALAPRGFAAATAPTPVSTPTAVSRDFAQAFLHVRFSNPTAG
jgi:hypothetical protein